MWPETSSTAFVTSLKLIETDVYRIGGPILILLGTISCLFSCMIFRQKNLRKNPCTIYFWSFNLSNFLLIYLSLFPIMLEKGYHVKSIPFNLIYCRLHVYILLLFDCLSSFYLTLASIDRMYITSPNAKVRRISNTRFAYKSIIIGTLFWMIFCSHALIFREIIPTYYSLIKGIVMPFLMILFGLLAIKNIRRLRRNAAIIVTNGRSNSHVPSSKDRKLIYMVLMNIIVYVLFDSIMTACL
ncbi:unnamed protein product, partial [Rotaria sp. Silwood1]